MIEKKPILQALKALRSLIEHYEASDKKKCLLKEDHDLYLQVAIKKIPNLKLIKRIKVVLPHRLLKDSDEVCLIVGDLDKKNVKADIEPDILHYKELLEKHKVNAISEVVTLRQLRTEYKQFEAKQKLLAAYDVFLSDNKITECLPKVLGRHFFTKRKFPIQINIHTSNLKEQIEKALSTKVFQITGHGNSCTCEVAYLNMKDRDIVDNIVAMTKALSDELPGSWNNVMGIYLKTSLSKAIPLYVSYDDPNEVQLDEVEDENTGEIDELTTHPNMNVKVYKDGRVEVLKIKDRSQEAEAEPKNEFPNESPAEDKIKSIKSEKNELPDDSMPAEDIKESSKLKTRKATDSVLVENYDVAINELPDDSIPAEDIKESSKLKKRKATDSVLVENYDAAINEFPKGSPAKVPLEDTKKSTKSKKRKNQDFSLIEDNILKEDELPHGSAVEDKKKRTKSKRRKSQDLSLMKDNILKEDVFPNEIESVEKTKKGLKTKRRKLQECSLENVISEKSEFAPEIESVKKTKKGLKTKRTVQECSVVNVISEKKRKNKGKHL